MDSVFMAPSPDQSRENRMRTDQPSTSRAATSSGTVTAKYQVAFVMSLPTAPSGAATGWAVSVSRDRGVRLFSAAGVSTDS